MGLPRITYPITFHGRTFSVAELQLIQTLTVDCAALGHTELAYTLCELVDWRRPTGRLKNHEGRLLLERLAAQGLVTLPPVRKRGRPILIILIPARTCGRPGSTHLTPAKG